MSEERSYKASNEDLPFEPSSWTVDVSDEGVLLTRMHEGRRCESYPIVSHAKGAVYLAAISQGFQPPRDLRACGKPVG